MTGAEPSSEVDPAAGAGKPRSGRLLLLRVLAVQALTLVVLYLIQVRFGIGAAS